MTLCCKSVATAVATTKPEHLDWNSAKLDLHALKQRLQNIPANGLLISAIPDARLQTERRALERLEHAEDGTVADLRKELAKTPAGIEAEDLYALAERLRLDLQLSGGLPGEYTAVFRRGPAIHFDGERMHSVRPVPWRDYGNDPLQGTPATQSRAHPARSPLRSSSRIHGALGVRHTGCFPAHA